MWITIAGVVSLIFGIGYLIWATDVCSRDSSTKKATVGVIIALILGILWLCCSWAQEKRDVENDAKAAEAKAYYEKCIVETRTEVNRQLKSYSKVDNCLK